MGVAELRTETIFISVKIHSCLVKNKYIRTLNWSWESVVSSKGTFLQKILLTVLYKVDDNEV